MKAYRSERISKEIQKAFAEVIENDIRDPRLQTLVVIDVKVSKDLKRAKIYYTTLKEEQNVAEALEKAKGFLRKKIAEKMEIKYMPEISFIRR